MANNERLRTAAEAIQEEEINNYYDEDAFKYEDTDIEMLVTELMFYFHEFNETKLLYNFRNTLTVKFNNNKVYRYTVQEIKTT